MDRLALIPFTRVNDFVRGESNNKECPTRFHVEARRRRPPEMAYKPKVDGILEYILYWCSFGPDDHRKGGIVRPSRNYSAKRKTPAGRPNTKRGCVCHFIVKRLIAEPTVALVIYNQDKHVDKKGLPCHGPQDKKAVGTRAMFAPYISDELRLQLMSLLYVGVPVETIMQRHSEMVDKQGGPSNRDDLLTHRYVRRLERKIRRSTYELDPDDAVSLGLLIESHQNHIFFFEDFSDSEPLVLGIQTEWQLQQMIRFGNRSLLACDSKFGANKLKYPICSLLVFDSNNNAIPVAWIITPNFASGEIHRWMGALYDRVHSKDPTWKLGGFIVDDPSADVLSIREVFKCSVLISFWRIRHAWHKNLMEKCSQTEMRVEMSRRLGEAVSNISRGNGDMDLFETFMEDYVDCSDFLDYFKAIWFPRIGAWTTALKALPLASTEVSAAIECYHHQLRLRLLNEKDSSIYQRTDWLVDKLGTKVHSYYWLDEYSEKDSFARYWKDEWKSGLTSWRQALQIPDSDVVLDGKCAKVVSRRNREKVHTVLNPGSEFAICDCDWSKMGNLCKHLIKSTRICRHRGLAAPSTSLFEYNRTLMSILNCPPHDSVIRDHAIALAVSVQTQLSALFDLENGSANTTVSVPVEQHAPTNVGVSATDNLENADEDLMNESQMVSENSDEVLRSKNHLVTKEYVAQETVNDNVVDAILQPVEAPSTGLPPIDQQLANKNSISDVTEKEEENLLNESLSLGSNIYSTSRIGDGSIDDMSIDCCGDEVTVCVASADQVSDGVLENSATEKMINIDPHSFQSFPSTSRFEVVNGVAEEECTLQISDVLTNKEKANENLEAHSYESMNIDIVEVSNGICHGAEKEPLIAHDSHRNIVENVNVDQNNAAIESGVGDVADNSGNEGQTIGTDAADHGRCGNADRIIRVVMSNSGVCDRDGKEVVLDSKMIVSEMDSRPCSGVVKACVLDSGDADEEVCVDQLMDIAIAEEKALADFLGKEGGERLSSAAVAVDGCSGKAPEEITSSVQGSPDFREGVKPSADIHADMMDVEISTDSVEEVHAGRSSGTDEKDGMNLTLDVAIGDDVVSSNNEGDPLMVM